MGHDRFFAQPRAAGATEQMIAAVRRGLKSLGPPYPEPEVTAAEEKRARVRADAEVLRKPRS